MTKEKEEVILTDTENFEGFYPEKEHLLLFDTKKLKKLEKKFNEKKTKKIDFEILDLYLSL